MADKKITFLCKHRRKKKPPSLVEVARSVVKTYMEPNMTRSVEEPKGLASGGFDLEDDEEEENNDEK